MVPRSMQREYRYLKRYTRAFQHAFGWDAVITSFYRNDKTAHRRGVALDFAFRDGPLDAQRRAGDVNYFYTPRFRAAVVAVARALHRRFPRMKRLLVELDHIHIEYSPVKTRFPRIYVFAPPKSHSFAHYDGIPHPLRKLWPPI